MSFIRICEKSLEQNFSTCKVELHREQVLLRIVLPKLELSSKRCPFCLLLNASSSLSKSSSSSGQKLKVSVEWLRLADVHRARRLSPRRRETLRCRRLDLRRKGIHWERFSESPSTNPLPPVLLVLVEDRGNLRVTSRLRRLEKWLPWLDELMELAINEAWVSLEALTRRDSSKSALGIKPAGDGEESELYFLAYFSEN